jgi:LysM repeat protein
MDSIIGRQRISQRRKFSVSAPSPRRAGPVQNIPRKGVPRKRKASHPKLPRFPKLSALLKLFSHIKNQPSGPLETVPVAIDLYTEGKKKEKFSIHTLRIRKPTALTVYISLALGAFLLALGILSMLPARSRLPAAVVLQEDSSAEDLLIGFISPELQGDRENDGGIDMPPLPVTLAVTTYTVRPGDALLGIANKYHITLDALISMNGITDARRIYTGARLRVPNISGIVHTVAKGDSIGSIASRYGISVTAILDANDLGSSTIHPGQALFIPGARMSSSELKKALGELVMWPIRGPLSSGFGYRPNPFTGLRTFHNGLDIVAPLGTPIKAAMDGRVADTGYNSIYGNYVILSHADGYQTLYGHMSKVFVRKGASLAQGEILGAVGTTGYSTGPHLHFSVFRRGCAINPLKLLK